MSARRASTPLIQSGFFPVCREDIRPEEVLPLETQQQQESPMTTFAWAAGAIAVVGVLAFYMVG